MAFLGLAIPIEWRGDISRLAVRTEIVVCWHELPTLEAERDLLHHRGKETVVEDISLHFRVLLRNEDLQGLICRVFHKLVKRPHDFLLLLVGWNTDWHNTHNNTGEVVAVGYLYRYEAGQPKLLVLMMLLIWAHSFWEYMSLACFPLPRMEFNWWWQALAKLLPSVVALGKVHPIWTNRADMSSDLRISNIILLETFSTLLLN